MHHAGVLTRHRILFQETCKGFGDAVATEHTTAVGIHRLNRLHDAVHALTFLGACRNNRHIFKHRFAFEHVLDHVVEGLFGLVRENVPLVEHKHQALARLADFGNNAEVLDFETTGTVYHKYRHVGTADTFEGTHVAENFNFVFDLGFLAKASRISHHELLSIDRKVAVNGVTRCTRNIGHHGAVFVQQAVQERALACVRTAENSKANRAFFAAFTTNRSREHGNDFVHQRKASIARERTDGTREAETELQELVAFLTVGTVFALVRHKNHLLVELADHAGKLFVKLGNAHANIHHKEHQVSFFDGIKNLGAHAIGEHVDGIVRQKSTGINHRKFMALVIGRLVMPIAGHAVAVRNDCGTTPQDSVKKRGLAHVRASNNTYDR